jgi:hypothetical protein
MSHTPRKHENEPGNGMSREYCGLSWQRRGRILTFMQGYRAHCTCGVMGLEMFPPGFPTLRGEWKP